MIDQCHCMKSTGSVNQELMETQNTVVDCALHSSFFTNVNFFFAKCLLVTQDSFFSCTVKPVIQEAPNSRTWMSLVWSCSCLCPIHRSQVLSREQRWSWSSADRRCSNYIWVINNFFTHKGASYITDIKVNIFVLRIFKGKKGDYGIVSVRLSVGSSGQNFADAVTQQPLGRFTPNQVHWNCHGL